MIRWIRALDRVLKGEATKPAALATGRIEIPLGGLTVVFLVLAAIYGACMGTFSVVARWHTPQVYMGYQQMGASAVKVPLLLLLTLITTFPSLYVFNALVGSRLSFTAVLRLLVAAMGVTTAVVASFGTILVFFSLSTTSYSFMVLLNVVMFAIAGLLGMGFMLQTLHRLSLAQTMAAWSTASVAPPVMPPAAPTAPIGMLDPGTAAELTDFPKSPVPPPPLPLGAIDRLPGQVIGRNVRTIFRIWVLVFGLVGAQMGWVLRPFIGNPNAPFTFFRPREGNVFQAVADRLMDVTGAGTWSGEHHRRSRSD